MRKTISRALARVFSIAMVWIALVFLLNNILIFWFSWPGMLALFGQLGIPGFARPTSVIRGGDLVLAVLQTLSYGLAIVIPVLLARRRAGRGLRLDADQLADMSALIIRAAFWGVFLIGLIDALVSFLRVENLLSTLLGNSLASNLGRAVFRGSYLHYPLLLIALLIAWRGRSPHFIWLGLLVVLAEFAIVISSFVFSYEQAFMGDLVRFWYGAMFLFGSAYALLHEGHVRVDVFYARFGRARRAWVNLYGSVLLGIPLCWIILTLGMWTKTSSLNSPLIGFEISQNGYGLYVKYLMAGFMVVFAVSMLVQFCSYILSSVADLHNESGGSEEFAGH